MKTETENIIDQYTEFQKVLSSFLNQNPNPFVLIAEGLKILGEKGPKVIKDLSHYGWFTDGNITPREVIDLGEKIEKRDIDFLDSYLSEYYLEILDEIKIKLINNNPERKVILNEAFENYYNQNYYSSITLLLTQVDGICFDKTRKLFFSNNRNLSRKNIYKPEIEELLMKTSNEIIQIILTPINDSTLINEHLGNLNNYPVRLNRHEIIHGLDKNYGTKLNNIKIISFINYIDEIIDNYIKDIPSAIASVPFVNTKKSKQL